MDDERRGHVGTSSRLDRIVDTGEVVEDDVPDGGVWMNGGLSAVFEGPTWE